MEKISIPKTLREARKAVSAQNYVEAAMLYTSLMAQDEMADNFDIQIRHAFCVEKAGNKTQAITLYNGILIKYREIGEFGAANSVEKSIKELEHALKEERAAAKAEAERIELEKENARIEAEKAKAEKARIAKAEIERIKAEKEKARIEAEKAKAEKARIAKAEIERLRQEKELEEKIRFEKEIEEMRREEERLQKQLKKEVQDALMQEEMARTQRIMQMKAEAEKARLDRLKEKKSKEFTIKVFDDPEPANKKSKNLAQELTDEDEDEEKWNILDLSDVEEEEPEDSKEQWLG